MFDLRADLREMHDLAGDPQSVGKIQYLMARLKDEIQAYGETAPLSAANPRWPTGKKGK